MERSIAIKLLIDLKLKELSPKDRAKQLETMLLESWDEAEDWSKLSSTLISEFEGGVLFYSSNNERYDAVLKIWIKDDTLGITNDFLKNELLTRGIDVSEILGEPMELYACPCCGLKSLESQSSYDICRVCWWEDDGQDNADACEEYSGPNYSISLAQARYNYLTKGIYDPSRKDLIKRQEPASKYEVGRMFTIVGHSKVREPSKNMEWFISPDNS